jgi:hypothetical protein
MPDPIKKTDDTLDLSKNPQFAQLLGVVTQIGKNQQALQAGIAGLTSSIETLSKTAPATRQEEKKGPSEDEINSMSQVELTQHLFKGVRGLIDGLKTDLEKTVSRVADTAEEGRLESAVDKLRGSHKDFDEWLPEIKDKIRSTGGSISIAEAYTLVRAGNAEKAKTLDEKYMLEDKAGTKPARATSFGGLTPTSRQNLNSSDEESKPLSRNEAAEKAWEEAFGENSSLSGEDSD